jgi:uncharacterized Zn-binding protein involved in type VI secretion
VKKGVARVGDMTSGHDGYPGTPIITGSATMLCDGKGIACAGDRCEDHDKSHGHRHTPIVTGGSSFFTVDGRPVAVVGSEVAGNCSSENVIIGGSSTMIVEE